MDNKHYLERYWRDAKPADAIKEPPMVARFRSTVGVEWRMEKLYGYNRKLHTPWGGDKWWFSTCQVYDAPDPGEGWRLIDPESTRRVPSDERWCPALSKWLSPDDCYCDRYEDGCFYRRRIEQPKAEPRYVPFTWEDREQLRGRWIVDFTGEQEYTIDYFLNGDSAFYICGHPAEYFLNWRFIDTGEPVGRRVE